MEKCQAASATTPCPTSGTNGKLYWKGTGSDPLAESDLAGNPQEEYLFFNGTRIARRDVSSTGTTIALHYYFSDHLGTHAVVENAAGTQCEQDVDYYPYGGQQNDYCTTPVAQNYKFNGKERDGESGLDNFGARYDTSNLGRFMTPDWAVKPTTVPYANFGNPQSLNLYSYVENNPTTVGDPDGHGPSCNDYPGLCAAIRDSVSAGKSLGEGVASYLSTQSTINTKPPTPKPPALVSYNGHTVSDSRVRNALSAISRYFVSSTVNVTSGDRDFVPKGGALHSAHLTKQAADFHVVDKSDSQIDRMLKDSGSPVENGFRLIQHGPHTATQGPHLHLDSRNDIGQPTTFMHEGMTPAASGVYTEDPE